MRGRCWRYSGVKRHHLWSRQETAARSGKVIMCKNRVLTSQTVSDKRKLWDTNARVSEQEFKTNRIFFSA